MNCATQQWRRETGASRAVPRRTKWAKINRVNSGNSRIKLSKSPQQRHSPQSSTVQCKCFKRQKYINLYQKYRFNLINYSDFAHPSPKFYRRSKSAKFWLDFRHQSPLTLYSFEMEQYIANLILPP